MSIITLANWSFYSQSYHLHLHVKILSRLYIHTLASPRGGNWGQLPPPPNRHKVDSWDTCKSEVFRGRGVGRGIKGKLKVIKVTKIIDSCRGHRGAVILCTYVICCNTVISLAHCISATPALQIVVYSRIVQISSY